MRFSLKCYCSNPKEFWGGTLCSGHFFFLVSVFSDFEIDDFWHLWYIIVKPLKSLFICTKGSLLVLFVWKLRGFKVLKNEQMNSEMRWTASISSFHLSPHMYIYISVNTNIFEIYVYMSGTQSNNCLFWYSRYRRNRKKMTKFKWKNKNFRKWRFSKAFLKAC